MITVLTSATMDRATGEVFTRNRSGGRLGWVTVRSTLFHLPPESTSVCIFACGPAVRGLPDTSVGMAWTCTSHGDGGQLDAPAGWTSSRMREPPVHSRFRKSVTVSDPGFWTGPV